MLNFGADDFDRCFLDAYSLLMKKPATVTKYALGLDETGAHVGIFDLDSHSASQLAKALQATPNSLPEHYVLKECEKLPKLVDFEVESPAARAPTYRSSSSFSNNRARR